MVGFIRTEFFVLIIIKLVAATSASEVVKIDLDRSVIWLCMRQFHVSSILSSGNRGLSVIASQTSFGWSSHTHFLVFGFFFNC